APSLAPPPPEVVHRTAASPECIRLPKRFGHVLLRLSHSFRHALAAHEEGGDGGSEGAAGAVSIRRLNSQRRELVEVAAIDQQVDRDIAVAVPALQHDVAGAHRLDLARRLADFVVALYP